MTDLPRFIESRYVRDLLDHVGTCPACGYPSQAHSTTTVFLGGDHESAVTVSCAMACGWQTTNTL
ncbi:hypothetical protein [Nocardia sp. NPDC004722]